MRRNIGRSKAKCSSSRMIISGFALRLLAACLLVSFAVSVSACSSGNSLFPTIPRESGSSNSMISQTTETTLTEQYNYPMIKIAAPVSKETADYLVKLYEAKRTGLLGEDTNGLNVSLPFLDTIEPSFGLDVYTTSSTGASVSSFSTWEQSGSVPDIVLADSLSRLADKKKIIPLNDLIADNPLLLPGNIYINLFNNLIIDNLQYGIPYSSSVEVIFVNNEVLQAAGISQPAYETDLNTIQEISDTISQQNDDETLPENRVLPFYQVKELIPYLPSSFDLDSGYLMLDGDSPDFEKESFEKSIRFLREYLSKGYSVDGLSEEEFAKIFGTLDPILAKRVAMWVGNSEEISRWANYMPYTLSIIQIPSVTSGEYSPSAITVYPLCISAQSQYPELAADFAAFISLDEDAVLLRLRLEKQEGFIPVIRSSTVWDYAFSDLKFSSSLAKLREQIDNAYFSPLVSDYDTYEVTETLLAQYSGKLLDSELDLDELLNELSAEYSG